jgi:hypothetical protein
MGFSFLLAEGWLEFGEAVEDFDPSKVAGAGDDGGRQWSTQSAEATASGIPAPLPLPCLAFNRAARAFHVAGSSPSFITFASGPGQLAACPGNGTSPLLPRMFGPAFSGPDAFGLDHFCEVSTACPVRSNSSDLAPPRVIRVPSVTATEGASRCSPCPASPLRGSSEICPRFSGSLHLGAAHWFCTKLAKLSADASLLQVAPCAWKSRVDALGHDEQSLAPHGVAGFGRREYSARNAVAQSFQCRDDGSELSVRVPRHVLSEHNIRPALGGKPADLGGEKALTIGPGALSGDGIVLAWVSRSEDMNKATPRSSVEGEHVRPDRSRMKPPCFHRRDQACGGCGFPLHVTDPSASLSETVESELHAEFKPSDACAQGQDVSHAMFGT